MTEQEAAAALETSAQAVGARIASGDLESRERADGRREVLVALPPRASKCASPAPSAPRVPVEGVEIPAEDEEDVAAEPAIDAVWEDIPHEQTAMVPIAEALRWAQPELLYRARRSARRARLAAAVLLLVLGAGAAMASRSALFAHGPFTELSGRAESLDALSAERDALRAQLAAAHQEIRKKQGELVIERNVEDTLFKAALAAHASARQPNRGALADGRE